MKSSPELNKSEIVNVIRAVPYVVIVRIIEDPRLERKNNDMYEYTLLNVKFIDTMGQPSKTALKIRNTIRGGDSTMHRIQGIYKFKPLFKTLKKLK